MNAFLRSESRVKRSATRGFKVFAILLLGWMAFASAPIDRIFVGTYSGSGRACDGALKLTSRSFSWSTPFTSIKKSPYEILEQNVDGSRQTVALLLRKKPKGWFYPVVTIQHTEDIPERFWSVMGYQSLDDYKNNNQPDSLGCLMIK